MSDRDRSSPSLTDTPLKTYIGRHDDDYPLINGNDHENADANELSANLQSAETPSSDESNFIQGVVTFPNDTNEVTCIASNAAEADEEETAAWSSDSDNETYSFGIRDQLQRWALKYQIPHNALNELLGIMRDNSNTDFKNVLPQDSRSLLKTPRKNNIVSMGDGKYWYNGLENCLKGALNREMAKLPSFLYLSFNIDGLPVAKSTKNEFWPILCRIDELDIAPLVVAIFFGCKKPPLELFLRPFLDDLLKLLNEGLLIKTQIIPVKIRCFICDTPARCFIKGTVGFNSYHGCMKCTIIGEYDRRGRHMSFPRTDMPLRTDHSFRNQLDPWFF